MSIKPQLDHWANQKVKDSYWKNIPAVKRSKWFAEQLLNYEFKTFLEVGCSAGRNLKYILERIPDISVFGIDINSEAIKCARKNLSEKRATLTTGDLYNLGDFEFRCDIVFSAGILIHIPTEKLKSVIESFISIRPDYIMHIEELGNNELVTGPKHLNPLRKIITQMQWTPDITKIYKDLGYESKVIPLLKKYRTNGASELIIVEL